MQNRVRETERERKKVMPEKNLETLLANINPDLSPTEYLFCALPKGDKRALDYALNPDSDFEPIATFREKEGLTLVVEAARATAAGLSGNGPWSLITCTINSDLNAVGFLAAMASALAERGISVNAFSAYYHDHLFVPSDRAQEALAILKGDFEESGS